MPKKYLKHLNEMAIKKPESDQYIWLRPGANVFIQASDRLQIAFPNFTVTFQTPEVVAVVNEIISVLSKGQHRDSVISKVTAKLGVDKSIAEYLLMQLISNNCAYFSEKNGKKSQHTQLDNFYAYVYEKKDAVELLGKSHFTLLVPEDKAVLSESVFRMNGMHPRIISAIPGERNNDFHTRLNEKIFSETGFIACWGFPYRLPTANVIQQFAMDQKIPILFGGCEGIVGRLGPFVIPFHSPCLECLNLRLLSNFDENEQRSYASFRVLGENKIAGSWISHPGFDTILLQQFSIEVMRIILGLTSNCLGSLTEYAFGEPGSSRHLIVKVPNCPVCGQVKPARFAWDYHIAAPIVKNNA